jgi:serine phosphatase RsbU (regulator of sigma subunit)
MPRYSDTERRRLERGLLPSPLLAGGRLACATYYRAAQDAGLGGDFLDVVERADGSVRAVVGDVMGNGPDEAAMGVQLRVAWRTLVLSGVPDGTVMAILGRLYLAESRGAAVPGFVTVCDLTLSPRTGSDGWDGTVRLAGHPSPIVRTCESAEYLPAPAGPPLGVDEPLLPGPPEWPGYSFGLEPDAAVLLYTDGLLDAYATDDDLGDVGLVRAAAAQAAAHKSEGDWVLDLLDHAPRRVQDDTAAVVLSAVVR